MTRPKPAYVPAPRILSAYQVAARLGIAVSQFYNRRAKLESRGFPTRDTLLCGWDAHAIEAWLDRRAGIGPSSAPAGDDWMDAINAEKDGASVP